VVAFTNYGNEDVDRRRALLVRDTWLQSFLKQHNLELLVAKWFERRLLDGDRTGRHPSEEVYSAARIDAELNVFVADSKLLCQALDVGCG